MKVRFHVYVELVGQEGAGSKEAYKGIEELEGEEFRSTLDLGRVGKEQGLEKAEGWGTVRLIC